MKDFSQEEAIDARIPIAQIMKGLTKDELAALGRGEPVTTASGTIFPMVTKLPGANEPMITAILSHMTQGILDDRRIAYQRFESNFGELLKATAHAAPEAMPAIKELLESYRDYHNATEKVVDTVLSDYSNMLASFSSLPSITIRAERGSAANKKHQNSDAGKAKAAAKGLWPEASRKGWKAAQFHTAITDSGHTVAFDTARKWLTALRKSGTC